MALFPRCNNPVPVLGRHGLTLVGCHSCIQCRVAAQENLCKVLEVEASKHKYVEFITVTYDDLHLPYIDTSYMYPFGYALRIPNRVIKKYNRRTKSFYFVVDKISKSFQLTDFSTIDTVSLLRDYYARIDKYYSRFPSRSRGIRNNSVIPILWYDDIRKYIGRLRKWFLKEYGETIRYYVICEYGSQSFRPHYHLLLFHDSSRARADFRIVRTLPQSTKENPREICVKLDLADLWVYGDTTSKVTDGNMQEYVSKYLTQHSDFPGVLNKFPQRSFHSILLGSKDRHEVRELLKARDFETLTTDYVVNKKGVRRPVSMSDAYYSQFAVKFTGSSCFNVAETSTLFRSVVYVARRFFATQGEIYDDGQVREFLLWLLKEKVKPFQALAVIVAFIGALFIIKPQSISASLPSFVGMLGGFGAGVAYTMVRKLSQKGERGPFIVFFFSAFSCVVTLPYLIVDYSPMTIAQLVILICAGIAAAGGQFSITAAYSYAPAREISVFDYTQIIFAAIMGFIAFGDIPDKFSIIGYVIICSVSVAMFLYNRREDEK